MDRYLRQPNLVILKPQPSLFIFKNIFDQHRPSYSTSSLYGWHPKFTRKNFGLKFHYSESFYGFSITAQPPRLGKFSPGLDGTPVSAEDQC
jgi:hypothetical protein